MRWNTSSTRMCVRSLPRDGSSAATARGTSMGSRSRPRSWRKTMRLPECLFALVALAATATVARADPIDLKPFRASFTAQWKGISAATSTLELRNAGPDTFTFATVNTPHGLFRMALPDSLTQASTFKLVAGRIVPLNFRGSDEKERPIDLTFDWAAKRVTGTAKDHAIDLAIPDDAQD